MKVFVTGASGFIGSAVVPELLANGHEVIGLARSGPSADKVKQAGATVLEGSLQDLDSLREGAKSSDAIVHLAFVHDFSTPEAFSSATATDRAAIEAMGSVIAGTGKALIIASGTLGFPQGQISTEDTEPVRTGAFSERTKSADMVYAMSRDQGVRGMVIRFSPTVHGKGDWGFMTLLGESAKRNGFATYINEGSARWSAVHRYDAAVLTRLALERGKPAATYNAVAEEGIPMKDIMSAIGERLHLPVESKTTEEAVPLIGFFAHAINSDNPTSSEKTRKELGWQPQHIGLLEDIKQGYFERGTKTRKRHSSQF